MFEIVEHTADLGIRVRAGDLAAVCEEAAQGLLSVLIENPGAVEPARAREIAIAGSPGKADDLLFDWLNELVFLFDTQRLLFCEFDIEVLETGVAATARGEAFDPSRHQPAHEVKAVTYHALRVEREKDGSWVAEVILDL